MKLVNLKKSEKLGANDLKKNVGGYTFKKNVGGKDNGGTTSKNTTTRK